MKNHKKFLLIVILLCVIVIGAILVYIFMQKDSVKNITKPKDQKTETQKVKIVDLNSNERPYAVMINNHSAARPQSGLQEAYLVYEFMVEGGITRMMALYTSDANVSKIGSIRSSRHYYLDYVLENDAIYIHWGGSTYAYDDLQKLNIDRIDGMYYGNKYFTTDTSLNRSLEHTRFSNSDLIKEGRADLKIRNTREKDYLFNYTTDDIDLSKVEQNQVAKQVNIKYSSGLTSSYIYDEETKNYYRSINGQKQIDLQTKEQYYFKNIIAYAVKYSSISSSDHQDIANIGSGEGYYIANGYTIPIKWSKTDRSSQTTYSYLDGSELKIVDGNTFVQIYPTNGNLTIN